jgi:hypothetical protein
MVLDQLREPQSGARVSRGLSLHVVTRQGRRRFRGAIRCGPPSAPCALSYAGRCRCAKQAWERGMRCKSETFQRNPAGEKPVR